MKVYVLASGSEGNASVFEAGGTRVLVDGGIGPQALVQKLVDLGCEGIPDAIVVTHAHQDHVGHTRRIAKKLRIPVFATPATAREARLGDPARVRLFEPREPFAIGAITVAPIPVPHDAAQVALVLSDGTRSAAIATDLGEVTAPLFDALSACDLVLVESNYDRAMLRMGPYPEALKRRVDSARGHLSNEQTHALLRRLPPRVRGVVLLHLSQTNNKDDIALASARDALAGRLVHIVAAHQSGGVVMDARQDAPSRLPRRIAPRRGLRAPNGAQLPLFPT